MAKANYGFEKRQRELAKKKKQEEKLEEKRLRKAAEKGESPPDGQPVPVPDGTKSSPEN